jgi:hypothetical protein
MAGSAALVSRRVRKARESRKLTLNSKERRHVSQVIGHLFRLPQAVRPKVGARVLFHAVLLPNLPSDGGGDARHTRQPEARGADHVAQRTPSDAAGADVTAQLLLLAATALRRSLRLLGGKDEKRIGVGSERSKESFELLAKNAGADEQLGDERP